jgi:hypothetical protein
MARCGFDLSGTGWGHVVGCCEHGNENLGSVKCGKFMQFLKKVKERIV